MLTVLTANGPSGYAVKNSLRFRSSASAYLNRTPSVAGNQTTWTWSSWVKLGDVSTNVKVLFGAYSTDPNSLLIYYGNNQLTVGSASGGIGSNSSALFRDPSAWYHIVVAWDTTQATSTNRIKVYVNGVSQPQTSVTAPTQNYNGYVNASGVAHAFGRLFGATPYYFDGYLADINFIDGQALTPSSFGEIDAVTGVWKPKQYAGTYGTNGFKLNFSNGTSTTTLGYDSSGNSNNWTTNNISLTAGSTYDWMIDSPSKIQGTSYGVGNYAVLNPLNENISGLSVTLSNGNLTASGSTYGAQVYSCSMQVPLSGKWYYENSYSTIATLVVIGIRSYSTGSTDVQYRSDGQKTVGGTTSSYGASWTTGDVIGIAIDRDAGAVTFYKNGSSQGAISIPTNSAVFDMAWNQAAPYGSTTFSVTYGQRPFAYTPPTGFKSLCTFNLPTPTIQNGAGYMAATLWTGTNANQSISNSVNNVSFQPDFVWVKSRSAGFNHALLDSIRGVTKGIASNSTAAETTSLSGYDLTAFNTNGFTLGPANTVYVNNNGQTFVGWQWKAGGTAVNNTAGSITSSVSANTTSGFSVVTATGIPVSGATQTVGHGLGVAPSFIIVKNRNLVDDWYCYHVSLGYTKYITLDTTAAAVNSAIWVTNPTSTVISFVGNAFITNTSQSLVFYCFAAIPGYSAFGSYTGNGSADGPFVYCGFRPKFILYKNASVGSAGYDWAMVDTSRNPYNQSTQLYELRADLPDAERSNGGTTQDILSNGFKIRSVDAELNGSGNTIIYAAFAENPFQNALAR